jgi:ABC-type uncharacterized transport system substrate-binding protein
VSSLPQGLQELGYVEGRDLEIVYRYVDGDYTRLPAVVDELNKLKPQVVVSAPASGVLAVNQAAPTIPIVGSALIDPVGFGLAASLAPARRASDRHPVHARHAARKAAGTHASSDAGRQKDRIAGQHQRSDQESFLAQRGDRRRRARG